MFDPRHDLECTEQPCPCLCHVDIDPSVGPHIGGPHHDSCGVDAKWLLEPLTDEEWARVNDALEAGGWPHE